MTTSLNTTATTPKTHARRRWSSARQDLELFFELLEKHNLTYDISWRWEGGSSGRRGANRDGVLRVYRGSERILRIQYERSSIRWNDGDCNLFRVCEGSNRHDAVLEAIEALKNL